MVGHLAAELLVEAVEASLHVLASDGVQRPGKPFLEMDVPLRATGILVALHSVGGKSSPLAPAGP